jgi:hypothetical protein
MEESLLKCSLNRQFRIIFLFSNVEERAIKESLIFHQKFLLRAGVYDLFPQKGVGKEKSVLKVLLKETPFIIFV